MKKAFYSSLSIHILVFILISITLPEIKTKEIDYISVEIINEEPDEKIVSEEAKENKKPEKKIKETKIIKFKPQPPKQKPIIKKENPEPKAAIVKAKPPQKKPKFKIKETEVRRKIETAKKENNDEVFDDMLKNLAKYEDEPIKPDNKMLNKPKQKTSKSPQQIKNIQKMIVGKIYKQIKENYSLPPAPDLKVLNDITVQLRIYVRPDGTINLSLIHI